MTQGERVKAIRASLHLTLENFGKKLGVGKTAISKIEKDEVRLTDQMTRAICREYNVNYDWLTAEEGDMFDTLPQTILEELCLQFDLDSLDRSLLEVYLELSSDDRAFIKDVIHKIIEKWGYWSDGHEKKD